MWGGAWALFRHNGRYVLAKKKGISGARAGVLIFESLGEALKGAFSGLGR